MLFLVLQDFTDYQEEMNLEDSKSFTGKTLIIVFTETFALDKHKEQIIWKY